MLCEKNGNMPAAIFERYMLRDINGYMPSAITTHYSIFLASLPQCGKSRKFSKCLLNKHFCVYNVNKK